MKLQDLFPDYKLDENPEILGIKTNSKEVSEGDLFLCTSGLNADRHDFLNDAISNGAVAAVVSKDIEASVPLIKVKDVNSIQNEIYMRFYDYPQNKLKLIALTGTDGKTSVATTIQHLLGSDKCGYVGTNGASCKDYEANDVHNTTPDLGHLLKYFKAFVDHGCSYVALEASSEAFYHHRLDDLTFQYAAISNIHREHLNTHKTMENYVECKKQVFRQNEGVSILNKDDEYYQEFKQVCKEVFTYGREKDNDLQIVNYETFADHTNVTFKYLNKEYNFISPLLGDFNVENLAEAFSVCLNIGLSMDELINNLNGLQIKGRMNIVDEGQDFTVIVDYAHTPNGVERFLSFVNSLPHKRVLTVIGQAGERDKGKRKDVGEVVARNSDIAYFTAEDPRNEEVISIIDMMCENISDLANYLKIEDRGEAIKQAIFDAETNDIVVILGKGGEDSMSIKNVDVPFNDIDKAHQYLKERLNRN